METYCQAQIIRFTFLDIGNTWHQCTHYGFLPFECHTTIQKCRHSVFANFSAILMTTCCWRRVLRHWNPNYKILKGPSFGFLNVNTMNRLSRFTNMKHLCNKHAVDCRWYAGNDMSSMGYSLDNWLFQPTTDPWHFWQDQSPVVAMWTHVLHLLTKMETYLLSGCLDGFDSHCLGYHD